MEQKRMVRNSPIKESSGICGHCGHDNDLAKIKTKYEARETGFTGFFCNSCNGYHRIKVTKKGLFRLAKPFQKSYIRPIIKADRTNCPFCDNSIPREDFDFLLKKKNYRRTTCQSCYGPLMVRRTVKGFYTTSKADTKRRLESLEKGINRLEFDSKEKKFKTVKENYYLWQKWKKLKS